MNDNIKVINWNKDLEQQALDLLNKYKESSLFLLSNIKTYGSKLTDASYSANFKCLVKDHKVVAVFGLTKIGSLLFQTDRNADYSTLIIDECLKEPISLCGIIGDWQLAKQILDVTKTKILAFANTIPKKSILFKLALENLPNLKPKFAVKYLELSDFAEWNAAYKAFSSTLNLITDKNEDESSRYKRFLGGVKDKYFFGLFINNKLAAIASFIVCSGETGQIGGVFTLPEMRQQGLAKELIYQLALDGKINKHLDEAVLFTSEDNYPAIKLYESLGFKKIGYFGLFFKSGD